MNLGGDTEHLNLGGDTEHLNLGGDTEHLNLAIKREILFTELREVQNTVHLNP